MRTAATPRLPQSSSGAGRHNPAVVGLAAVGFMYLVGLVIAFAIYKGRKAPMIASVPAEAWKTGFLIGCAVGVAYLAVFVGLVL